MKVTIGKPIHYNDNVDEMISLWSEKINDLTKGAV